MSSKRQKKRKPSEMFDLDRILATVKSNESNIDNIREHMKALRDVDLQYILTEKVKLTEEEALTLASFQAGVQGIVILKEALRHVPENITRNENGKSMRFIFVCKIFRALASDRGIASTLKDQQIELLCQFLESYCRDFVTSPTHQSQFWTATYDVIIPLLNPQVMKITFKYCNVMNTSNLVIVNRGNLTNSFLYYYLYKSEYH
jgi:hypothetical protein